MCQAKHSKTKTTENKNNIHLNMITTSQLIFDRGKGTVILLSKKKS